MGADEILRGEGLVMSSTNRNGGHRPPLRITCPRCLALRKQHRGQSPNNAVARGEVEHANS